MAYSGLNFYYYFIGTSCIYFNKLLLMHVSRLEWYFLKSQSIRQCFRPEASTYITLYTLIGGAAVRYATDKTNNQQGETDLTFLLEPAEGLEWELSDGLHLNLSLSYRLVSGVDQPGAGRTDQTGRF